MDPSDLATTLSKVDLQAEDNDQPLQPDNSSNNTTKPKPPQPPTLLTLPPELRLQIYSHATSNLIGSSLVRLHSGRLQFRLAWPLSPLDYRSEQQLAIDAIASTSQQIRRELLPIIMRGFIVKFPAWTPEFKVQCMHWIEDVSDLFCRCVDWIWLEGLYWRVSILLGREEGGRREEMMGEDERARGRDVHMHEGSQSFERNAFVIRVDFQRSAQERALRCAARTIDLLERLLLDSEDGISLGREQIGTLLSETPLTGTEQHRVEST
ncbi:hypothetical protein CKM354_001018300 [Cercospora kikuchii]|uniref:Uncharacterized protein n=1 Tax=Cercospora kikuchii TaxID=84275 RepID=A0A9P3CPQ7_9PEZI|nr:uncharacterized protein CKM354_001018300 [Cercospora kikuchii]GIZ47082.1 hypothetical protein CKM354_001018300 [Cercospora kikuchii]